MKKSVVVILLALSLFTLAACGNGGSSELKPEPSGSIDVAWETGAVTVEYYEGIDIVQAEQGSDLLIQVPQGAYLEEMNIFAPEGAVEVVGVLAAQYDIETVGDDINIYLPEGTAFHVMLTTIRDIFESDFLYDVTSTKHEYIYLTDGVEITLETVIGVARVMTLK